MSLIDQLLGVVAPHECLACGAEGALLCPSCRALLPDIPERCYRCRRVSPAGRTCTACRHASRLYRVRVATDYEGFAQDLVWRLKFAGALAAAQVMAEATVPLLAELAEPDAVIVPVPTATSRIRQRGYDQAVILARTLAKRTGLPLSNCLMRQGQTHQVGASRRDRLQQLVGAFRIKSTARLEQIHIILIDDVVTTGATLEAAAAACRAAGARRVDALIFAQP